MVRWRLLFSALVLLAALVMRAEPVAAQAGSQDTVQRLAIEQVIRGQMAAFQRDDGQGAFAFAAPSIREMFGTPDSFMAMVRQAYAAVYRPANVRFGDLAIEQGALTQKVHVVGPDGQAYVAHYAMQPMDDGSWKIKGVWMEKVPELAA